ncbi:interleukin-1 receptor-like 1 [Ctenopharyngodon idella]|uniref:interleukin-1 receptor-like 1 n=1 Tax=Ctenopharyngodon idella TaxID=7959 RepID=UPI00222F48CE|nr:interleukin-1 receptor-like 1 [Ctenopharyngodon idella]
MMMRRMRRMLQMILLLTEYVLVSSYQSNSTVKCERSDERKTVRVMAGESLYLPCPNTDCHTETENTSYEWFKYLERTEQVEQIGTEESERIHYHLSELYILWLTLNDTGRYITRWWYEEDKCDEYETDIVVYEEFNTDLLYRTLVEEKASQIHCPVCEYQQATFIWYKDFSLIPNQEAEALRIRNSSKESEGIYTCVCTWEHNGIKHNTSASRRLTIKDMSSIPPAFQLPVNNSIVITDVGTELILQCSVFFGRTVCDECFVHWERNKTRINAVNGYKQETRKQDGIMESFLTITKVSELDLRSEYRCRAEDSYKVYYVSVILKRKASMLPEILACVCTFLLVLVLSGIVKWFSLDLVLFLREIIVKLNRTEDGKLFDAYVIYQRNLEEKTDKTVSDFVNGSLVTVLESYCGFKLFIHGRDDLPGEDCMNMTESKIQLSRRLIIILTSGTSTISSAAYDLELGLHQALVQGETGVILIQLGQMKDYTHLPLGLQHLLCKNSPLLWRDGESSPSSRFWKRVRYRMPVASSHRKSSSKNGSLECQRLTV